MTDATDRERADDLWQPHSQTFREIAADPSKNEAELRSALEASAGFLEAAEADARQKTEALEAIAAYGVNYEEHPETHDCREPFLHMLGFARRALGRA